MILMTLMDGEVIIDVTSWEHIEVITSILPGDVSETVSSIENATVNVYNSVTLNVGKSSSTKSNPIVEVAVRLYEDISSGDASYSLSQIVDVGRINCFPDIPKDKSI